MAITTDILSLPVAVSVDGSEYVPIVQGTGGSAVTRRVTTASIANTATGFVPDTASVNSGIGLTGGGLITSDPTLSLDINELTALPAMAIADSFAVNDVADGNLVRKVTFPNAMKAIPGLTELPIPNLTSDFLVINHAADGETYKISPSALSLAAGNVPAGGSTGQSLVKASNADYDTEWSTGGFLNQGANVVFSGPASGAAAAPDFRALVGADLPNPAASAKGGVFSYAAVSNQFLTQIGTDGSVASAQPAFSNISGTATVAQGGTGLTAGTSGGVLGYTASGTLASSVALTANALVLGGGAGATPAPMASLGTTTTVLHGNAAGAPTFGAVALTTDVSGTLPVANGGTGNTALAALTKSDDTNVTMTLGGSPTTALVNAASLTLGWTGTLAVSRGGIGVGTLAANGVLLGNGTSAVSVTAVGTAGQILAGNTAAAPTWQGVSAVIDNLGSTQGQILYRNGSAWVPLAPGTSGQVLQTGGAGANPSWTSVGGTGTVTSVDASGGTTGMSFTGGPVTTSGTLTLAGTLAVANGGTGITAFGTGVATALGINVGSAGAFVTFNGALGTPSSGSLANCTGLPVAGGGTGLASTTAYAVLCGGTTSTAALQSIASVGTSGHVLTSNGAGALPTFQAASGGFPSGTLMLFQQTSAPTGWTKQTTHNDKALRVVSGAASSGGTNTFSAQFTMINSGATTLTTSQIPAHSHSVPSYSSGAVGASGRPQEGTTGSIDTFTTSNDGGTGGSHLHTVDLAVAYVDLIIASKD